MFSSVFKTLLLSVFAIGVVEANLNNQCSQYYLDASSRSPLLRAQCSNPGGGTVSAYKYLDHCLSNNNGVLEPSSDVGPSGLAGCNDWGLAGTVLYYTCKKNDGSTNRSNIDLNYVIGIDTSGNFAC